MQKELSFVLKINNILKPQYAFSQIKNNKSDQLLFLVKGLHWYINIVFFSLFIFNTKKIESIYRFLYVC